MDRQNKEISALRQQVEILLNKLNIQPTQPLDSTAPMELESQSVPVQQLTASNKKSITTANKNFNATTKPSSDHKFNILLYGIPECSSSQNRPQRMKSDLQNALQILSSLDQSINTNSIRDIFRLGKFKKDQKHPKPLLIKFLCSTDAFSILASRNQV